MDFISQMSFIKPACKQLQKWKSTGNYDNILLQDNGDKNKLFNEQAQNIDWKFKTKYEYTPRATFKHNSPVEVGFVTLARLAQAMLMMQILIQQ